MLVFIMVCFMALAGKHAGSNCPVELSPPSVVVRFRDPLWANCEALTDQIQGMGWEASQEGKPLTPGVTSLALDIKMVTDWELRAFCFINKPVGAQCVRELPITVYKTPDNVLMSDISGPLVQGRQFQMRCDVFNVAPVNKLSVRWYKGSERVKTETFPGTTLKPVSESSVLTLSAHRDDHEQSIWCEAALTFGPGTDIPASQSQAYKMEVLFPPAFSNATDEEHELRDGSPLILNCNASGNPAPVYRWTFPDPIQLMIRNQTTHLPVLMPIPELPGVYKCKVSNSLGTAIKSFTVIEPERHRSTFAAMVGAFVVAGILLAIVAIYFVTPDGTFAFNKGSYQRGRPTSSGPV
ncbi:cell adhesion molecule 3-like [Takifugu flavidus]|uniref:cell adhesion molecule 3-like n=1 Tax=Takifugu flavidus TaxID=433684 RepID=UPI0025449AE4|nr:cell adhesion molecule 3-like [Takifugu flavidus]